MSGASSVSAGAGPGASTAGVPEEASVSIRGTAARVWTCGTGDRVGFLAGIGGLPRWPALLDRLAAQRTVVAPSLPGFPGASEFRTLDSQLDWLLATHDLVTAAGLSGVDLVGVSVGAALAADVAAVWPQLVRRLVLVSPLGLFDEREPTADLFAQRPGALGALVCADPAHYERHLALPDGADAVEWSVQTVRAQEAAARLLWPIGDTGLAARLPRIECPTLLIFGDQDQVIPASYHARFHDLIPDSRVELIAGAGHLADLDAPDEVAAAIIGHLG